MNINKMKVLFKRELLDILRDKKTVIMMIIVPILLYPLMIVGMTFTINAVMRSQEDKTYLVAFYDADEIKADIINRYENAKEDEFTYDLTFVSVSGGINAYENALDTEKIEAYITKGEEEDTYEIHYLSAKNGSETAAYCLKDVFSAYREDKREEKIIDAGLSPDDIFYPVKYELKDMSTREESIGSRLGGMMPFLIITVILMGAIYPSIDVTAGERERGTLETLLTLPVTNFEMIMSKFLAVSVIASASAFLNVFSMGGAVAFLVSTSVSAAEDLDIHINLSSFIPGICFTVVVMMCFALLVTAVCMCVCIFAKNFKEANNYITPVMLIFMFGSYSAMLPDLMLTTGTAAIPIVNVSLLVRDLFKFQYDYGLFAIVLLSTIAYSIIAIRILSKIYDSEDVLFNEGFKNVRIFEKRSDIKSGGMPGTGDLVLLLSIVMVLMIYLGSYAYVKLGTAGVAVQQGMILIAPLIFAWYMKADHKKLFMIKKPLIKDMIGGVLIGAGAWPIAMTISVLLAPVFKTSLENASGLDDMVLTTPIVTLILISSLMPAVGEELLFRGFTFGTLKERFSPALSVCLTSIIFAAYHMSVIRFFALLPLSLALTYVAYRTGSIFVTMLMHFINNTFSLIQSKYPEKIAKIIPMLSEENASLSDLLLIAAAGCMLIAIGAFILDRKKKTIEVSEAEKEE